MTDLPIEERLRTLWLRAIACSIRAKDYSPNLQDRSQALDRGLAYLKSWYELGRMSGWSEMGSTAEKEIYAMTHDDELKFLYVQREGEIRKFLGEDQRLLTHVRHGGGGGCLPAGVLIESPAGPIRIDDVRVGMSIFSVDLRQPPARIHARVARVYQSREEICVRLDGRLLFTPSQPLYQGNAAWILAGELIPGSRIETADGQPYIVSVIEKLEGCSDVYTLTTDHPSHNFLVAGVVCKNKMIRRHKPDRR